jgi:2,3-diketo-5-methylthio-1-phosphopentane phosphatase
VTAGRDEMMALVRERVHLRPGFKELRDFCCKHLTPLAIVTNGLDFYVRALLEREGLADVPFYSVETAFTPQGIRYSYPYSDAACPVNWGNCKCLVLDTFRRKGYRIAYVGDGRSDFCPALQADIVFARSSLSQHCLARGIPFVPFEEFHTVLAALKEIAQEAPVD